MTLYSYQHVLIDECNEPLVNLVDYNFVLSPFYFECGLSATSAIFLRQGVAEKLVEVQEQLAPLRLKIWDGWRSRQVQTAIYRQYWNELTRQHPNWGEAQLRAAVNMFVTEGSDPGYIPPHATGGAVDLTLVDAHGQELPMGTGFDHFGPESASLYFEENDIDPAICQNRRRLREALTQAGFRSDSHEWWHYDYGNQLWAAALGHPQAFYGEVKP